MEFTLHSFALIVHVLAASLWFGGGVFQVLMVGSALMRAGPAALGFMQAVAKKGGFAPFFAISGIMAVVSGGYLYYDDEVGQAAFKGSNLWLTVGAIVAVLALLEGLFLLRPLNGKWVAAVNSIKGAPTAEQGKTIAELGARIGKTGARSVAMISLTMLCMLLWRVGVAFN